jgi:very-short-patch-repair endonuclease
MWGALAAAQDGVISRAQLRAFGLSDAAITRLISSRQIVPVAHGVLLARGAPLTFRARLWVAVLATDGVIGFATAAFLWGCEPDQPHRIDVIVPPARRVTAPHQTRLHRVAILPSAISHRGELPVTTRPWTILDHLGRLPQAEAYRLADRALQRGWVTPEALRQRRRDYPGRQGNKTLRLIADRTADRAAAESERILHRLLRRAAITGWKANHAVWCDGELVAVVDVALVARRIAIEVDGWAYHSDVDRFQRDRSRQNALTGLGWTVVRFTWADLTQRPGYVVATLGQHLAHAS